MQYCFLNMWLLFVSPTGESTCSAALIRAVGGGAITTGAREGQQILLGGVDPYVANSNSFKRTCANNEAEKSDNSCVS